MYSAMKPAAGVNVRVTCVPAGKTAEHPDKQLVIPAGLLVTLP
jgi:hypothetical protein